ncbi:zinc-binding alcohol dehydrogenase [Croceivirga thetidis]|uniref:Zinc-binding alcohol dehydrogenase n=1 Tax=Croceivirga thetidis TaxID=2721623 RepID=A0ABX1GV59_9FLAO|nr:zinc-binding alcohol dehydrogenase [Croceivirga thetidis]NKI32916.1 zinc-binding alcohol dehydrogenase [Croceivirga thetidis]
MKLKELPISLFQEINLGYIPPQKLISKKEILPVIVSLTTIMPRLKKAHLVIRSILNQDQIPEKIILNINTNLEAHIPKSLRKLEGERFEIHYSEMDCPHMKLIPTLKRFPNKTIVTCDDDLYYQKNWLSYLYEQHLEHPKNIVSNQSRIISFSPKGDLLPYKEWPTIFDASIKTKSLLPIGSSGTIYPPKALNERVFDEALFQELAPKADDLWFKAMSLMNNTESIQSSKLTKEPLPIFGSQIVSLKKQNIGQDKNRTQWLALTNFFNLKLND